ncbi:lipopolysaccharide heptosyltransferase RfaC [Bibersteinia trehalosi]|uniref:lipopolysaccharide heptosyltransferase RfaC n=1 Tax=Bibersteinia trehalosi TaxID=47735 RepID=UPI003D2D24CB
MKVCVIKTSSMGDVIHTLPALTDAQRAIPNLQVDWVVEKAFSEIPNWHSAVNRVIPLEIRRWRKNLCQAKTWQEWQAYKATLQAVQYDAIIDAQGLLKSALLATRLAQGKKYGYDCRSAREGLSSLFYDQTFNIPYQQHAVERIRQLFACALGYQLTQEMGDYGIACHFVKNREKKTACLPYIIAVHATTRDNKHWEEDYWTELFALCDQHHLEVRLPWGNEQEKARAERLAAQGEHIRVLPKMSLTELAAELANAKAVVSVDTGLSHLAAALDTPNIILYGATNPKLIGAYGKNQHYLQANRMQNIQVSQVWQALEQILTA